MGIAQVGSKFHEFFPSVPCLPAIVCRPHGHVPVTRLDMIVNMIADMVVDMIVDMFPVLVSDHPQSKVANLVDINRTRFSSDNSSTK